MADLNDIEEDVVDDVVDDTTGDDDAGADDAVGDDDAGAPDNTDDDSVGADDDAADKAAAGDNTDDKPSRKESRVQKLAKERNELREKLAAAEAVAAERVRAGSQSSGQSTAEAQRLRNEKLALMDDGERKQFLQDEKLERMEQQVAFTQISTADMIDRSNFALTARSNSVYAKHLAEVERRLSAERSAGRNWNREQVLAQIVGELALKAKPNAKAKNEARERVNSSQGKPIKGRSDSNTYRPSRGGKESLEDLERRLENVTF